MHSSISVRFMVLLAALLSCFFSLSSLEKYEPIATYLTWQRSPESTMTIRWVTSINRQDNLIQYKSEEEDQWITAKGYQIPLPANSSYLLHTIELTNLQPDTKYSFQAGVDAVSYKFQTMPAHLDKAIRFVAGGDMYHDTVDILSKTNRQAAKANPHFALVGGDIAYAADKKVGFLPRWTQAWIDLLAGQKLERWLTWLTAWKNDMVTSDGCLIPMLPVIGNHDTSGRYGQTPLEAPFFYSLFAMPGPQGYNVLDFGNYMSIFLLDSGHTHPISGDQTIWLANNLEQRQAVPNKFALYHVPAYPSVRPYQDPYSMQIRKNWVSLFDQFYLTAAFENHDHAYKRSHPLLGGKINPTGVLYIGDGAWGVDKPRKATNLKKKWYLAKTIQSRHFLLVEIQPESRYVGAISPDGEILDEISW